MEVLDGVDDTVPAAVEFRSQHCEHMHSTAAKGGCRRARGCTHPRSALWQLPGLSQQWLPRALGLTSMIVGRRSGAARYRASCGQCSAVARSALHSQHARSHQHATAGERMECPFQLHRCRPCEVMLGTGRQLRTGFAWCKERFKPHRNWSILSWKPAQVPSPGSSSPVDLAARLLPRAALALERPETSAIMTKRPVLQTHSSVQQCMRNRSFDVVRRRDNKGHNHLPKTTETHLAVPR